MRVINRSSQLQVRDVRPLLQFVAARCEFSHMAHVVLEDRADGVDTSGLAYRFYLELGFRDPAPSRVILTLGPTTRFPRSSEHRSSVGTVTVNNWREDLVFVAAHEFRHITQFYSVVKPYHYEVDAERHAFRILEEYRKYTTLNKYTSRKYTSTQPRASL